jgi:hypothetical protein
MPVRLKHVVVLPTPPLLLQKIMVFILYPRTVRKIKTGCILGAKDTQLWSNLTRFEEINKKGIPT